jgi:hypothetical protein
MEYEQDEFDFLNMILKDLLTNFCHCCIESICNEALKSIYILQIKPEKMIECYLRFLKEKIINIEIECKNKIYGCQERIRYGELHYHLQECKFSNKNNIRDGQANLKNSKKSPINHEIRSHGILETADDGHVYISDRHNYEMEKDEIHEHISLDEQINNFKFNNSNTFEIDLNYKPQSHSEKKSPESSQFIQNLNKENSSSFQINKSESSLLNYNKGNKKANKKKKNRK